MRVPRSTALEVFGLKENFSKEELKREYKRLVKIVHPDAGGDENLFKFIETCKNILINGEDCRETNINKSDSYEIDLEILDLYITERDGTIWVTSDGITEDTIQKLDEVNLDGAKSTINSNELNY